MLNAVVARFPHVVGVGDGQLQCGLVHRLDVACSGALLVALEDASFRSLRYPRGPNCLCVWGLLPLRGGGLGDAGSCGAPGTSGRWNTDTKHNATAIINTTWSATAIIHVDSSVIFHHGVTAYPAAAVGSPPWAVTRGHGSVWYLSIRCFMALAQFP